MPKKQKKDVTKAKEPLLQDFTRSTSRKTSALFYCNAFIFSVVPIWVFWRIYMMDIAETKVLLIVVTLVSTYLLAMAYRNTRYTLKPKIAIKRQEAIRNELSHQWSKNKKMSTKEKEDRIRWKTDQVADYEATMFSIFYNNALFVALVVFLSVCLLRAFPPSFKYAISIGCTSTLLAILSVRLQ